MAQLNRKVMVTRKLTFDGLLDGKPADVLVTYEMLSSDENAELFNKWLLGHSAEAYKIQRELIERVVRKCECKALDETPEEELRVFLMDLPASRSGMMSQYTALQNGAILKNS